MMRRPDMGHIYTDNPNLGPGPGQNSKKFIASMIGYNIVYMEKS